VAGITRATYIWRNTHEISSRTSSRGRHGSTELIVRTSTSQLGEVTHPRLRNTLLSVIKSRLRSSRAIPIRTRWTVLGARGGWNCKRRQTTSARTRIAGRAQCYRLLSDLQRGPSLSPPARLQTFQRHRTRVGSNLLHLISRTTATSRSLGRWLSVMPGTQPRGNRPQLRRFRQAHCPPTVYNPRAERLLRRRARRRSEHARVRRLGELCVSGLQSRGRG